MRICQSGILLCKCCHGSTSVHIFPLHIFTFNLLQVEFKSLHVFNSSVLIWKTLGHALPKLFVVSCSLLSSSNEKSNHLKKKIPGQYLQSFRPWGWNSGTSKVFERTANYFYVFHMLCLDFSKSQVDLLKIIRTLKALERIGLEMWWTSFLGTSQLAI